MIEIKGLKASHFEEVKELRAICERLVQWGMSNVLEVSDSTQKFDCPSINWHSIRESCSCLEQASVAIREKQDDRVPPAPIGHWPKG
jgi:hypothetical protein